MRYAIRYITARNTANDLRVMAKYMPSNYSVSLVTTPAGRAILISGEDVAGWTLTEYCLPRLASGLYFAREITADEAATFIPVEVSQ